MLNHGFGIHIRHDSDRVLLSYVFGVSDPRLSMLNYLHINTHIPAVDDILLNLSSVLNGEKEAFMWGADWCIITSRKEQSTIQYYDAAEDPDWFEKPLFMDIPTAWFVPVMRDWQRFLTLNPTVRYQMAHQRNPSNSIFFYSLGIEPIRKKDSSDILYHLRVNHLDYEMDLFSPLVGYNQLPKIDAVLHNLVQVVEKKQESYVWGQKGLKLTSHAEQTAIEYQLPNDPTVLGKAIPTAWLVALMWDWRLFMELNPKTVYLHSDKPKAKRVLKKK